LHFIGAFERNYSSFKMLFLTETVLCCSIQHFYNACKNYLDYVLTLLHLIDKKNNQLLFKILFSMHESCNWKISIYDLRFLVEIMFLVKLLTLLNLRS